MSTKSLNSVGSYKFPIPGGRRKILFEVYHHKPLADELMVEMVNDFVADRKKTCGKDAFKLPNVVKLYVGEDGTVAVLGIVPPKRTKK